MLESQPLIMHGENEALLKQDQNKCGPLTTPSVLL